MTALYRLIFLILLAAFLSGSRCTSIPDLSADLDSAAVANRLDFAEDTAQIIKFYRFARKYQFTDAEKSMFYSRHMLRLAQKHQWAKGKILAYNALSTYYLLDGSYDLLRELSNETMTLSKKLDLPLYDAYARRFLAESYSEYRQWDSARINYNQAIATFAELGEDSAHAMTLENLANCYREKFKFDSAVAYYRKAYDLFEKIDSDWGRSTVLQSIGYMKVRQNNYPEAEKYFKKSLALSQKINSRYGELNTLNDLSNTYFHQGEYDKAIEAGKKALEYSKIYHSTQQVNWALITLSRAYKEKGMADTALDYNIQVNHNRRMVHDEYVKRQFTMYELMYLNEEMGSEIQAKQIREQEIIQRILIGVTCAIVALAAFLWFNNKKLRRKNAEIQEALIEGQTIERKRVAAELHDHLGGTLASLNWYLYGIDKRILSPEEQKIYESIHQMVGAAYKEVRSLSHNLMPAELEEHGLVVALERLVEKLNENKNIQFKFNLSGFEARLNGKIEFELYSIVLELTNNIIKHSGATEAVIDLREDFRNVTLVVSDNGSGIAESSSQGVGLKNIKNRVESLHGKIRISNEDQPGMTVALEIPKTIPKEARRTQ